LRCWQVAGTHCCGELQGVFAQKLERCEKCKVFKAACPDKITLLGETFNNMMAVLEQKVREQEELQRRLYHTSKLAAIGELAAGVAHEINNPLTGILGSAILMKSKLAADEESKKRLNVIESEALRARDIVRNLLGFAHQGNSLRLVLTPVRELLQQTLFLVQHQTDLSKIKIAVNIDDNLPPVAVDPNQMKQVFMNIIHNAIQSMPGGGQLDIYAHISKDNNQQQMLQIDFTDTGIGMDEQALSRIFDPFFTTKQVGEGTGLGLSLSQRIVSEHGGEIKAKSKPGKGSTFTVSLPVTKETDTPSLGKPSGQQVA
jgi:two-component system NtrC family sensor kinase